MLPSTQRVKDLHNQAVRLMGEKNWTEAEALFTTLVVEVPFDHLVHYNLGNLLWETQRPAEAGRSWRRSIACQPDFVPAMVNLSNALDVAGDRREALRYIQMAARRLPNDTRILVNLASILMNLGEAPHALDAIEHAYRIDPKNFEVAHVRMSIIVELKLKDRVESACHDAIRLRKTGHSALAISQLILHYSKLSRWDDMAPLQAQLREAALAGNSILGPMQVAFSIDDPGVIARLAREVAAREQREILRRSPAMQVKGKLTIGYLSPDLRNHPVAHMLLPVLRCHDRERFKILTLGTLPSNESELTSAINQTVDGHLDLSRLDDSQAVDLIRNSGIDVLVDLAGATQWQRSGLLALRAARTQLLWLGCPTTTGLPFYDGFLVDNVAMTESYAQACTEPLYRLDCCYHPISRGYGAPNPALTRDHVGLPNDAFVVGLLQMPTKIQPPFTEDIIELMKLAPKSHLWMRTDDSSTHLVTTFFANRGIDPQRITLSTGIVERSDYLAYPGLADLLIDSYPYGGHSTTGEALAMGHPVVTRAGQCLHTRVAASMLTELGLTELVAHSRDEYMSTILRLIADPAELARIKVRTRAAAEQLTIDGSRKLTRSLETAYLFLHNQPAKAVP